MPAKLIFPGVYALGLGPVNAFLIDDGTALTLIDTGYGKDDVKILAAVQELGRSPGDIKNIVVTHCHPDHAGGLAALKKQTGASAWMSHIDAEVVRGKVAINRSTPSRGLMQQIMYRLFIAGSSGIVDQAEIEHEIADGDVLPFGGGLRAIAAPGHSAGHLAFMLERDGGLLFAADACSNMGGLSLSIVYDDHAQGRKTLAALAKLTFAAVCFGHGPALSGANARKFNQKWEA